ncbi:chromosome segregation in meiosis protein 3 (eplication Fork Protection Component Swi3) [Colletotrichum sojae]|uniref:Chromosome segregation in meiosis protein n=1 Tax=Colletotrichum sojae TaxID=2175907 RepID=A0A8H6JD08_9PEZI|nr:chromosome segregation in meiosis protein 3 (eplication Fork Protection Component Swi3) [Colletotrichum sojae]
MSPTTVPEYDDLDNYAVDDIDDPFRSPPSELQDGDASKKRKKAAEELGLDEAVEVAKRVRIPRVKLDEARLLSENGIPKLRKRAADLKFRGKGHEFSDAARLLSFYQLWLDDLFPKAKFVDALSMVEKAGHKRQVTLKRMEWIEEAKPKPWKADQVYEEAIDPPVSEIDQTAPLQLISKDTTEGTRGQLPQTPDGDVPVEKEIYEANIAGTRRDQVPETSKQTSEQPEDDDLDALMAEAEFASQNAKSDQRSSHGTPIADNFADEEAVMAEMDGLW